MKVSEFLEKNPVTEELQEKLARHLREMEAARWVRAFENCGVCGHALQFEVQTDRVTNKVQETGRCLHCQQKTPTRIYRLH